MSVMWTSICVQCTANMGYEPTRPFMPTATCSFFGIVRTIRRAKTYSVEYQKEIAETVLPLLFDADLCTSYPPARAARRYVDTAEVMRLAALIAHAVA